MKFLSTLAYCFGGFLVIMYISFLLFKPKEIESEGFMIPIGTDWINHLFLPAIISYFGFIFSWTTKKKILRYFILTISLVLAAYVFLNL